MLSRLCNGVLAEEIKYESEVLNLRGLSSKKPCPRNAPKCVLSLLLCLFSSPTMIKD
jgi:hypothetical protein